MTDPAAIAHHGGDARRADPVLVRCQRPEAPRTAAGSRPDTGVPSVHPRLATSGEAPPDDSFLIRSPDPSMRRSPIPGSRTARVRGSSEIVNDSERTAVTAGGSAGARSRWAP